MEDNERLILTVLCTSYNQVDYIRVCLDGIVMQKCSFSWEAIVHDDASSDGTQEVILEYAEKYPDIIKPILQKENLFSKKDGSLRRVLMEACRGKYIANLEGDDYWTDPFKLQKQVDYLENHPECGLVRTDFDRLYQGTGKIEKGMFDSMKNMKDTLQDYLMDARFAGPCTWVYRAEYDTERRLLPTNKYFNGDLTLLLEVCRNASIKCLDDNTAVYRVLDKSVSHSSSPFQTLEFLIRLKNTRILYAKHESFLFKIRLWFRICKTYRSKYKSANRLFSWMKTSMVDLIELLFVPNKYF